MKIFALFISIVIFTLTSIAQEESRYILKENQCKQVISELNQCYEDTGNKYICIDRISEKYCLPERRKIGMCKTDLSVALATVCINYMGELKW